MGISLGRVLTPLFFASVASGAVFVGAPACGNPKGAIMMAINTDMRAPKDVNAVSVSIRVDDRLKHNFLGRVTPDGEVQLPSTLALVEPESPNSVVRIRVIAFQETKPRVLRDVRTTIPRDGRIALLRLPMNFVNDGSATGEIAASMLPAKASAGGTAKQGLVTTLDGPTLPDGEFDAFNGPIKSICPEGETVIEGECKSDFVDSGSLPAYEEAQVFGGPAPNGVGGACFDAPRCLGKSEPAPLRTEGRPGGLDLATCIVTKGQEAVDFASVNLALQTPSTGECIAPGKCLVPLDRGTTWFDEGATVRLLPWVCKAINRGAVLMGDVSKACPPKVESLPVCQGGVGPAPSPVDGGVDGSTEVSPPELVVAEDNPMSVAVLGDAVYFANDTGRVAHVLRGTTNAQPTVLTFNPEPLKPKRPLLARLRAPVPYNQDTYGLAIGDQNSGSMSLDIWLHRPDVAPALMNLTEFPAGTLTNDIVDALTLDQASPSHALVLGTTNGLFRTTYPATSQLDSQTISAVAVMPGINAPDRVLFVRNGAISGCDDLAACKGLGSTGQGNVAAVVGLPGPGGDRFFFLKDDGLYERGPTQPEKRIDAPAARTNFPRDHQMKTFGPCVFFTSNDGSVRYLDTAKPGTGEPKLLAQLAAPVMPNDGGGPLQDRPTLALDIDDAPPVDTKGGYVYYTFYQPRSAGGGVYRSRIPGACLPTGP